MDIVAIHEAGHAVVALKLGCRVEEIVVDKENNYGCIFHETKHVRMCRISAFRWIIANRKNTQNLWDNVQILFAGKIAEEVIFGKMSGDLSDSENAESFIRIKMLAILGRKAPDGSRNDMEEANRYIKTLAFIEKTSESKIIAKVIKETYKKVCENSDDIVKLANILEEYKKVTKVIYCNGEFDYK